MPAKGSPPVMIVKLVDDWLPIPDEMLRHLGWTEGTEVEFVPLANKQVVIRKKDLTKGDLSIESEYP